MLQGCVRQQWPWLVPAQRAAAPSFVGTFDFYGAKNEAALLLFANKTSFINADTRSPNEGEDEWELIFSFAACSSLLEAAVWLFPATVKVSVVMSNKDKDPDVISASSGCRCLFPTVLRGCLKWTPKRADCAKMMLRIVSCLIRMIVEADSHPYSTATFTYVIRIKAGSDHKPHHSFTLFLFTLSFVVRQLCVCFSF